ncbi:MAG: M23 family metallopeptidase [Candidatus Odinarchaeota archaeon]
MMIDFLPSGFLINSPRKMQEADKLESSFMLRAVRVKNTAGKTTRLTEYVFDIKIKGTSHKQVCYPEEIISNRSASLKEAFNKYNLSTVMGTNSFWQKNRLSSSNILEPGQETGFLNEHFTFLARDLHPVDELFFTVNYVIDGRKMSDKMCIPVRQYDNKNSYIFPVKGSWMVVGNWDDIDGHRSAYSQEFAFDLDQLDEDLQVKFDRTRPNEEYRCHGEEIIAIADGTVVDCFDQIPENPGSCTGLPKDQFKELAGKYGATAVFIGNYVVLEHQDGEYSFYGHLITGSLKVKKGDKVKEGQVLGNVGNSGNSDGPHLHFQLMDGPSLMTARGLPCYFTNIVNHYGKHVELIDRSRSIIHTV